MVVQHNISGMNANRQLNITTGIQAKSSEKLSSGYRINRAADDAAGLAISEKMRRQVRGITQASSNVQDGVSYVQVADAALAEIDEMLARIDVLCVQAANETLTAEDRRYIDMEVQKLKVESNRTFGVTSFNDKLIWDQNTKDRIQIGTEMRPLINWDSGNNDFQYVTITDENKGAWPSDRLFRVSADNDGATITWKGYDGINYTSKKIPWPADSELKNGVSLSLNASTMDYDTYPSAKGISPNLKFAIDEEATKEQMISALNGYTLSTTVGVPLSGRATSNGVNLSLSGSMDYVAEITSSRSMASGSDTDHIYPSPSDNCTISGDLSSMSFTFKIKKGPDAVPSDPSEYTATATFNGTLESTSSDMSEHTKGTWWYVDNYGVKRTTTHSYGYQGNLLDGLKRALDTSETSSNTDSLIKDSTSGGTIYIGFSVTSNEAPKYGNSGDSSSNIGSFKLAVPVSADVTDPDTIINLIRNINTADLQTGSLYGTPSKMAIYSSSPEYEAPVYGGTMLLNIQAGSETKDDDVIPLIYDVLSTHSLKINDLNTLTVESSLRGIEQVKVAAQIVDEQRSIFGAYQNRMEHSFKNLDNVVENTQAAESLVRDTDMAEEMVRYSNNNILAQAGQAILAQANQTNQGVMSLLQ